MREGSNGSLVDRDGMLLQAFEVVEAQPHHGWPKNPLPPILGKPKVKSGDHLGVDLEGAPAALHSKADHCPCEAAELVLEQPYFLAVRIVAQKTLYKGR